VLHHGPASEPERPEPVLGLATHRRRPEGHQGGPRSQGILPSPSPLTSPTPPSGLDFPRTFYRDILILRRARISAMVAGMNAMALVSAAEPPAVVNVA